MFENKILRIESGKNFHLKFEGKYLGINYTGNNSAKKIMINTEDFTYQRLGTVAYCDEQIELSAKKLLRIRDKLIIKNQE